MDGRRKRKRDGRTRSVGQRKVGSIVRLGSNIGVNFNVQNGFGKTVFGVTVVLYSLYLC